MSTGSSLENAEFLKMIIQQMQPKTKSLTIIFQILILMEKKTAKINLKINFKKIFHFLYQMILYLKMKNKEMKKLK